MTGCICDYDLEQNDIDSWYVRSNKGLLCPEHDICECCYAKLATHIEDGEKLCSGCLEGIANENSVAS